MSFIVVNTALTRELLPMDECIEVMQTAMIAATQGAVAIPPRLITPLQDNHGWLALMPGCAAELATYGAKIVGLHPANPDRGLPAVQGFVCLFDLQTGRPSGLVDGAAITAIRTAAASGLATRLFAREDAETCGILGTGTLAETHAEAMSCVRNVREILIWGRDLTKAQALAGRLAERFPCEYRATAMAAEAAGCDIVCTVTGSPAPVLQGEWVRPGAHVNLVGAHTLATREADTALVVKSSVYVDSLASTRQEGGDIMIPIQEGAIDESHIVGELGAVAAGKLRGRRCANEITLYNSLGVTAQDLYATHYVLEKARRNHAGVAID